MSALLSGIRADNIDFVRGSRHILRQVCVHVAAGELVALIGPNGAGKSTLLRILTGEWRPRQGRCLIDALDVHCTPGAVLARHRAVLPQDSAVNFPLPVSDIIALGRTPWRRHATPAKNRVAVHAAADAVNAAGLLSRSYHQLSGGERRRVQLARVLAQVWDPDDSEIPRYLLLDEPTASLDIGHQQRLLTVVRRALRRNIGVLAVLHDLNLAATFADRIYLLHRGVVVATGTPAQVLQVAQLNRVYAAELDVHTLAGTAGPTILPRRPDGI